MDGNTEPIPSPTPHKPDGMFGQALGAIVRLASLVLAGNGSPVQVVVFIASVLSILVLCFGAALFVSGYPKLAFTLALVGLLLLFLLVPLLPRVTRPPAEPPPDPEPGPKSPERDPPGPAEPEQPLAQGIGVFVYGSLLNPKSLARTLERDVRPAEFHAAELTGYQKTWGAPVERLNMVRKNWQPASPRFWLSLEIQPAPNATCFGAVVDVSEQEMAKLDRRELSYERLCVTQFIRFAKENPFRPDYVIHTYAPKRRSAKGPDGVVSEAYWRMVTKGLESLEVENDVPDPPCSAVGYDADLRFALQWCDTSDSELLRRQEELESFLKRDKKCIRKPKGSGPVHAIPTLSRPVVFSADLYQKVRGIAEAAVVLTSRALSVSLEDDDACVECGFTPLEVELARIETEKNASPLPAIARVDLTVTRDDIRIFEVNCDSPAGMAHVDALNDWYRRKTRDYVAELEGEGLPKPDALCVALEEVIHRRWRKHLEDHQRSPKPGQLPVVAIVDSELDIQPARSEFYAIRRHLGEANCIVCEPKDILYDEREKSLTGRHPVTHQRLDIDVVYKRILWRDLEREGEHILRAWRDGSVVIVNSLRARLAGNKRLLALLQESEDRTLWEGFDRDTIVHHFAETKVFAKDEELWNVVAHDAENWVVKAPRGHGAKDIKWSSTTMSDTDWKEEVGEVYNAQPPWIVQRRYHHGMLHIPFIAGRAVQRRNLHFIVGAFVVDGDCVALEAKAAVEPPISMNKGASRTIVLPATSK